MILELTGLPRLSLLQRHAEGHTAGSPRLAQGVLVP